MTELVLSAKCRGHDNSVVLADESGNILYALTEERFSNKKHDMGFVEASLLHLKREVSQKNLGHVGTLVFPADSQFFIEKRLFNLLSETLSPEEAAFVKKEVLELLPKVKSESDAKSVSRDFFQNTLFSQEIVKGWIFSALRICGAIQDSVSRSRCFFPDADFVSYGHHLSHAASSFYPSTFDKAALLCMDGMGESETISLYKADQGDITCLSSTHVPYSLGSFYETITEFLGFDRFSDPYKVMGMAAYGNPNMEGPFSDLIKISETGEVELSFGDKLVATNKDVFFSTRCFDLSDPFKAFLGGPRQKEAPIEQRHFDLAASFQLAIEKAGVRLAKILRTKVPDCRAICLSGGVALNGLMNQRILKEAGFEKIYIQPASADDGSTIGAAYLAIRDKFGVKKFPPLQNMFLGLERPYEETRKVVDEVGLVFSCPENPAKEVAQLLSDGNVVARYSGRSEFGPRALGNRSILASPLRAEMKDVINKRIKHREPFRPFAPACLAEDVPMFFDADKDAEYMLLICKVMEDKKHLIPAVVHADGTARVQSVKKEANPFFYDIIYEFKKITGVPVIINTSFNVNGEAIVETPLDAIECFLFTDIDYLLIEDMLVSKKENSDKRITETAETFLSRRKKRYEDFLSVS